MKIDEVFLAMIILFVVASLSFVVGTAYGVRFEQKKWEEKLINAGLARQIEQKSEFILLTNQIHKVETP